MKLVAGSAERTQDAPREAHRRALVVLGMHRSGTSALTRVLTLAGATAPKHLMPPAPDNPTGFWESIDLAALNDEVLQGIDSEWDDIFAFRPKPYLSNFDHYYLGRGQDVVEANFDGADLIVLKDPRVSVLTPFWHRVLQKSGYQPFYLIVVRNPLEVAGSLLDRGGFSTDKSLLLWTSYMLAAVRDTRDKPRVFVQYERLLDNPSQVLDSIERASGFPLPRRTAAASTEIRRFLAKSLRHHHVSSDDLNARDDIWDFVKALYAWLLQAAEGQVPAHDILEHIERELLAVERVAGGAVADLKLDVRGLERAIEDLKAKHEQEQARILAEREQIASSLELEKEQRLTLASTLAKEQAAHERAQAEAAHTRVEVDALSDQLEIERGRQSALAQELQGALAKHAELQTQADGLAKLVIAAQDEAMQARADVGALSQSLEAERELRAGLVQDLETERNSYETLRREANELAVAVETARLAAEKARSEATALLESVQEERAQKDALSHQLGAANQANRMLQTDAEHLVLAVGKSTADRDQVRADALALSRALEMEREQREALARAYDSVLASHNTLRADAETLAAAVQSERRRAEDACTERDELTVSLATEKRALSDVQEAFAVAQRDVDQLSNALRVERENLARSERLLQAERLREQGVRSELVELSEALAAESASVSRLRGELEASLARGAAVQRELTESEQVRAEALAALHQIRDSNSWRLTGPMRRVMGALRRSK